MAGDKYCCIYTLLSDLSYLAVHAATKVTVQSGANCNVDVI